MIQLKITDRQALRDWENYLNSFIASVTADENETKAEQKKRMELLHADFEAWKVYYFPKYCYAPPAKFHKKASKRVLENEEWYEVRAWARELSKDVVTMMETLYQVLTKQKKNIILVSNSWDKANELLTPYQLNLERNERIINDYGIQYLPGSWRAGDFITTQGASFLAVGAGQSPRGSRNEEVRPDKVIISDMDTDEECRNIDIINNKWQWFEEALLPTRSVSKAFQVIWLGNIIAKDCCVVRAMKFADHAEIINLEDKNGQSTWPEKNLPEHIARIKSKMSTKAYEQEYMNNPVAEGSVFKEIKWGKCPALHKLKFVVVYGDPSPSNRENKNNSFKSAFMIGMLEGIYYIYTGYLEQVKNSTFAEWFYDLELYAKAKTQVYFYIENNSLQDPFFQQVFIPLFLAKGKEKEHHISISGDDRKKPDKFSRIEGNLEPINRRGGLVFNEDERGNPHMLRLEEQFKMVNPQLNAPADGPDCIEGGVWIVNNKSKSFEGNMTLGKRKRNSKRF